MEAGTIVVVPRGESSLFLKVTNPEPTTRRAQRRVHAGHPGRRGRRRWRRSTRRSRRPSARRWPIRRRRPPAATVFPATGVLGEADSDRRRRRPWSGRRSRRSPSACPRPGRSSPPIRRRSRAIAEAAVHDAIDPGHELVAGSVKVDVGDAIIVGQTVSFPVTVTADQIAILDPAELEAMVLGKPVTEAKAILEPYGDVEISVSPDWSGSIPSFESRVDAHHRPGGRDRDAGPVASRRRRDPLARHRPRGEAGRSRARRRRRGDADRPAAGDRSVAAATWRPTRRCWPPSSSARRIDELVVGLPLEASGDEGPQAALTRAWGEAVAVEARSSGRIPRRAADQPSRRDPTRTHETRSIRRTAEQDPARRLPGAGRSRGRRHHPPGRTRHTRRSPFVHTTHPRPPGDQQMTIRSGGRPRDTRAQPAHPYDPDAYATETIPEFSEPVPAQSERRRRRRARHHRLPEVPGLRARPRRGRPRGRPDRPPPGRRQHGHDRRRGQPGGTHAAVRRGHRPREPRAGPDDAGLERTDPGRIPRRVGRHGADHRAHASRSRACSATAGRSCSSPPSTT